MLLKEKNNLNKLIAEHIISSGIEKTSGFNYIIYLDSYLKEFDKETNDYILNNKDKIINYIVKDDRIADVEIDEKNNSIDMVYYINSVLDRVEKIVYDNADIMGIDLEVDDVRSITDELLDDDAFNDDMIRKIQAKDRNYEI